MMMMMPPPTAHKPRRPRPTSSNKPDEQQSLAERNALRFAVPSAQQQQQPSRSIYNDTTDFNSSTSSKGKNREELEGAKSLIGTCPDMCPNDEMIRRSQENDIQLLELPLPGTLHPEGWTLVNTLVKRFRRSAADYKLDVPEWVRPPDVLEHVCGYLEEWVMVRVCVSFCDDILLVQSSDARLLVPVPRNECPWN